jgi:hypothetical protein
MWYYNIISRAISRATAKKDAVVLLGAVERHHILPKSFKMGGDKDDANMAYLSLREHFIVHKLLMRMFSDPILTRKMRYGFVCFSMNKTGDRILRAVDYAKAKAEMVKLSRMRRPWNLGRESPFKGRTHTEEIKQKISKNRTGQKTSRIYTPLSDDTKQKLSDSKKGKISDRSYYTEEYKRKNSNRSYNSGFNKIVSGTVWINNGKDNKRIMPEQLESYPGFIIGRLVPKRLT